MYVLGIGDLIKEGIAGVLLLLDTIIYGLISGAYKIFMALASARILSSDAYSNIANSLYAVIGVVMLFVLAYAVIRMIMDPDQTTKGELSGANLVKGIATAVIGLAIAPTIFEYLYQAQGLFVEHDVIGKIFFRNFDNNEIDLGAAGITTTSADECQNQSNNTAKTNCYVKSVGGAVAATSIWTAFFYPSNPCDENGQPDGCKGANDITIKAEDLYVKGGQLIAIGAGVGIALGVAAAVGWIPVAGWVIGGLLAAGALIYAGVQTVKQGDKVNEMTGGEEISLADAYAATSSGESFIIYTGFLSKYQSDGDITYLMGVSTLCGIFALYAFVSFSIDMGVRAAKLAYYQIIAPIPLVLQIIPKFKKNYTQYISNLFQTFIEVFIRISVVYIVVYIICHLTELFSSADRLWENNALNTPERYLALALLIMGLIIFAKDAPKIITDSLGIQGGMGDFKSLREKLAKGGFFGAAGIAYGGLTAAARDARNGWQGGKGFGHNVKEAFKAAGRGARGAITGAGRSAWDQYGFIGPHKQAENIQEALDKGENAAEKHMDAVKKRKEDQEKLKKDKAAAEEAEKEKDKAYEDLEQARKDLADGKISEDQFNEFERKYQAALRKYISLKVDVVAGFVPGTVNVINKIDAWSAGSIDTSKYEQQTSAMDLLDEFKDKTRAATAKSAAVQSAQQMYNQVMAETVSEYDEDGFAKARKDAKLAAESRDYSSVAAAKGISVEQAREEGIAAALSSVSREEFKRSADEMAKARADLQARQQAAKDLLESTQDQAFAGLLAKGDAKAIQLLSDFASQNAAKFKAIGDERINVEIDGKNVSMSIAEMMKEQYGLNVNSGVVDVSVISDREKPDADGKARNWVVDGSATTQVVVSSTVKTEAIQKHDGTSLGFEEVKDEKGNVVGHVPKAATFTAEYDKESGFVTGYRDVDGIYGTPGSTMSVAEFNERVVHDHRKAEAKGSKVRTVADAAKKFKTSVVESESYQTAFARKRAQKDKQSGGGRR